MPPALHGFGLASLPDNGPHPDVRAALAGWAAGTPTPAGSARRGLYLYGPAGTGKTTAAAAATFDLLKRTRALWVTVPQLMLTHAADFRDPERERVLARLAQPCALVLDDIGQETPTEAARSLLHAAIDLRVAHQLPLLMTSNFKPSELGERYGQWLPSRIQGHCVVLRLLGADHRLSLDLPES